MGRSRPTGYAPGKEADPGRQARARAWRYVFDCYEKKKVAGEPPHAGEKANRTDEADYPRGGLR